MKWILTFMLLFLLVFVFCFPRNNLKRAYVKKVHVELESRELAVVFLNQGKESGMVIVTDNYNLLLPLGGVVQELLSLSSRFDNDNSVTTINVGESFYDDNFSVVREDGFVIQYYQYQFCVLETKKISNLGDCDFIFLLDVDEETHFTFQDRNKLVFLPEKKRYPNSFLENLYSKYVEFEILSTENFPILKISDKNYHFITVLNDN